MAYKPTQKPTRPVDPHTLNHADFRWFILHFPATKLKEANIRRALFVAVGLTLAQFGDYATGTKVNPSKKTLHNLTGAHNDTITKVFNVLKATEAIEVTDSHQGSNGGQPYEVFRFRLSPDVEKVLAKRDALDWQQRVSVTSEPASITSEPGSTSSEPASASSEDNRNPMNVMNEKNSSVEESPSLAPLAATPSASDGATWFDDDFLNELVADL